MFYRRPNSKSNSRLMRLIEKIITILFSFYRFSILLLFSHIDFVNHLLCEENDNWRKINNLVFCRPQNKIRARLMLLQLVTVENISIRSTCICCVSTIVFLLYEMKELFLFFYYYFTLEFNDRSSVSIRNRYQKQKQKK